MSAPRDIHKRLEIAKEQIEAALAGFDRVIAELNRCRNDLKVCVDAKHTDFYRCNCTWLREKGEACRNEKCLDFGGTA